MPLTVIHTSAMLGALKVWISRYALVRGGEWEEWGEWGDGGVLLRYACGVNFP
jgi:hypothetical protein